MPVFVASLTPESASFKRSLSFCAICSLLRPWLSEFAVLSGALSSVVATATGFFMWGFGFQTNVKFFGGLPLSLRIEYNQHRLGSENIAIGNPANVYFSANVKQQIDIAKASVIYNFGSPYQP